MIPFRRIPFWIVVLVIYAVVNSHPAYGTWRIDSQDRLITTDRSLFDTAALARVAKRLGAEPYRPWKNASKLSPYFELGPGVGKSTTILNLTLDSALQTGSTQLVYRIAVAAEVYRDEWAIGPTQAFLRNAYLEEVLPTRTEATPLGLVLEPKDKSKFRKRTLLFAGYGASYAREGNPFSPEIGIFWPSVFDGIAYLMMVTGVANLSSEPGFLGTGLFLSAAVKLNLILTKESHIEMYNRIATSGYRIPEHVVYDSLVNRAYFVDRYGVRGGISTRAAAPERERKLEFKQEKIRAQASFSEKYFLAMAGPLVGMIGGYTYGSLKGGTAQDHAKYTFIGMLVGIGLGVQIAISI